MFIIRYNIYITKKLCSNELNSNSSCLQSKTKRLKKINSRDWCRSEHRIEFVIKFSHCLFINDVFGSFFIFCFILTFPTNNFIVANKNVCFSLIPHLIKIHKNILGQEWHSWSPAPSHQWTPDVYEGVWFVREIPTDLSIYFWDVWIFQNSMDMQKRYAIPTWTKR